MKKVGERIAEARRAAGLSQSELARRVGVSPQAVQHWESGSTEPRNSRLEKIAEETGVTVEFLLTGSITIETKFYDKDYVAPEEKPTPQQVIFPTKTVYQLPPHNVYEPLIVALQALNTVLLLVIVFALKYI